MNLVNGKIVQLSFSAAQRYMLSPASYFLHYIARIRPTQLSSALIFGGALDLGLNSLLEAIRDERTPSLGLAKVIFADALQTNAGIDTRIKGNVKYSKADLDLDLLKDIIVPEEHAPAWYSLAEKGKILIEEYYEQVLPKLEKVLTVQHEIILPNAEGDTFIGIVDFVAQIGGKNYLVDNKSTSVSYKENSANESAQLASYYEALKDEFKLDGVCFLTISKKILKKKRPRVNIQMIFGLPSEELLNKTFQEYDDVLDGIKAQKFSCSGLCQQTPWGCQYLNYCKSGDMTGLEIVEKRK